MRIDNILVTGRLYKELKEQLNGRIDKAFRFLPEEEVSVEDLSWADAFVGFKPTANFHFANLKWVHALGAGVDSFLFKRQWKKDVLLTRTVCSFGRKISEYCLSYILRDLQRHESFLKHKQCRNWQPVMPLPISTQNFLVFGTGVIGQELAANLALFGAKVNGVSQSGRPKKPFDKIATPAQVHLLTPEAQWVINTLPLTADTYKLFNKDLFKLLDNACFINVGRGASIDEPSLLEALDDNNLRLAVLDVFCEEPLPERSGLWDRSDIILTPHISAVTPVAEAADCFLEVLQNLEANTLPAKNLVRTDKGY